MARYWIKTTKYALKWPKKYKKVPKFNKKNAGTPPSSIAYPPLRTSRPPRPYPPKVDNLPGFFSEPFPNFVTRICLPQDLYKRSVMTIRHLKQKNILFNFSSGDVRQKKGFLKPTMPRTPNIFTFSRNLVLG